MNFQICMFLLAVVRMMASRTWERSSSETDLSV